MSWKLILEFACQNTFILIDTQFYVIRKKGKFMIHLETKKDSEFNLLDTAIQQVTCDYSVKGITMWTTSAEWIIITPKHFGVGHRQTGEPSRLGDYILTIQGEEPGVVLAVNNLKSSKLNVQVPVPLNLSSFMKHWIVDKLICRIFILTS